MPSSWSTKPAGTCPRASSCRPISPSFCCRRSAQSSTRSRTSGSSCATTGSPTASSNPTTISSTIVVRHGTSSSTSLGASCPSDCANGPTGSNQWDLVLHSMKCALLKLAQVAPTDFCLISEVVLRQPLRVAQPAQVRGKHLSQVHASGHDATRWLSRGIRATRNLALELFFVGTGALRGCTALQELRHMPRLAGFAGRARGRIAADLGLQLDDVDELVGLAAQLIGDHRRLRRGGRDHADAHPAEDIAAQEGPETQRLGAILRPDGNFIFTIERSR